LGVRYKRSPPQVAGKVVDYAAGRTFFQIDILAGAMGLAQEDGKLGEARFATPAA